MSRNHSDNENPVNMVFSLDEGRLTYIADLAQQLSHLAARACEPRLARLLDLGAREANRRAKKSSTQAPPSIVGCVETVIRVKP